MLRFLLIIALILYCIYKIGTLFFRAGAASQQFRAQRRYQKMESDRKQTKKDSYKGGEYIDYEEVK